MKHPSLRRRSGFSLIELMIVLVILAILAGIIGVKFTGLSKNAKITAAKTQLSSFKQALDRYELDMGQYPTSADGLSALIEKPADGQEDWKGPYLSTNSLPKDQWDHAWVYRAPGQHFPDGYDLWSSGPDGEEGGGDDLTNWDK